MSQGRVLVTGATGDIGGYAIAQLLHKGHPVRALVHRLDDRSRRLQDKGVEVVAGDYLDLDAMRAAVQGVRRAYFVYPICPGIIQATAYFAQAAREAGLHLPATGRETICSRLIPVMAGRSIPGGGSRRFRSNCLGCAHLQ